MGFPFLAAHATYLNVPDLPATPAQGHEQIRAAINRLMAGIERIDFRVHHIAGAGAVVLTARTDVFHFTDGRTIELPVMGAFEVADGNIAAWHDYFNAQSYADKLEDERRR